MLLKQFAKNTKTFCWGYIWGMQESMDCIKAKFITTNIFQTRTNVPFHVDCGYQFSTIFTTKVAGYNHVIYGEELQDDEVLILTIPDLNGSVCRSLGMGFLLSTTFCLLVCKISDEYADISRYSLESWST